MSRDVSIATEEVPVCLLCGDGGQLLYQGLTDRLFGAPGEWGHLRCPCCGLVWLNPRPTPTELHKVYAVYYTHADGRRNNQLASLREKVKHGLCASVPGYKSVSGNPVWRQVGCALGRISLIKERVALPVMHLDGMKKGALLDVGCGNGDFLSLMRAAGWNVTGVEPDAMAAEFARDRHGIPVVARTLENAGFADHSFDAVILNHVIEHVFDPVSLLRECGRVIKPSGRIVIVTPNIASRGCRIFGSFWIHLDPPRHLHLFSCQTIQTCCEASGLTIGRLRTSARTASWVYTDSKAIERRGVVNRDAKPWLGAKFKGLAFQYREESLRKSFVDVGEELVVVAGRRS